MRDVVGEVIGGYKVVREIGRGGMGKVYLGRHLIIGRYAAIKVLAPELSFNEEAVTRILTEARLAGIIKHPGIVDVYEYGRLETGSAYLIMEYLEGETLGERLDRTRRLPLEQSLVIARQIASAVGAAHGKGIVHRDLKPDNVFIVRDDDVPGGERARVLDFGIAKLSADLSGTAYRTRTGRLLGTPVYMSPEQCRGVGTVDARSDIYALGCVLYEMLTGRVPFELEGTGEIITAHLTEQPLPPKSFEPSIPAWLDAVIVGTLAKRPEERPQTMEELLQALGGRLPTASPLTPPPLLATPTLSGEPLPRRRATTHRASVGEIVAMGLSGRRRRLMVGAAGLAVVAALAFVLMPSRTPLVVTVPMPPPPSPSQSPPPVAPLPPEPVPPVASPPPAEELEPLAAAWVTGAASAFAPEPLRPRLPSNAARPARPPRSPQPAKIETLDPFDEKE